MHLESTSTTPESATDSGPSAISESGRRAWFAGWKRGARAGRGLPAAWKRGRLLALGAGAALMGAALWPLAEASRADALDSWWLRARFAWRHGRDQNQATPTTTSTTKTSASSSGAHLPIVLVLMDDKTAKAWPEPLAFWGPRMAPAIDRMTRDGARVIALDWIKSIPASLAVVGKGPRQEAARELFADYDSVLGAALGRARRVVLVKSLQNDGRSNAFVMPTPEILYSLPNAFGHEEEFLGYDGFTARASIVAAQAPALLRDASDKKGERVGAIEEMGFATRVVEKATDRRWAATAGGLVLNPPQEGRKKPREKGASTSSASGAHRIPLREDGTILINYAAPRPQVRSPHGPFTPHAPYTSGAFRDISLARVARGDFAPGTFANAIVLVGSTFTGANDFHFAPLASPQSGALGWASPRTLAGVEIQAHIVDTLLRARPLSEPPAAARWAIAWALSIAALALGAALPWARAALAGGVLAVGYGALSLQAFASDLALPLSLPLGGMLASGLLMAGYRLVGEERQRQAILKLWGRYQHPRVVEYLLHNPHARGGEGEEVPATILFADLKSFTKTVEHLPPGDAIRTLNRYLGLMQECVDENGGLVDKYLGDGLLAQWGAPDEIGTRAVSERADVNAESAVRACWQMMQRADALSAALQMAPAAAQNVNEKTFGLRLSLHSGPVIAGWVGAERIEYTVIGDAVNVCSRLQETAKEMGCDLLISQSTYDNARRIVRVGRTAEVEIRGRDQPLQVYEVVGLREPGEADEPEDADDADGAQPGAQPGAQVLDRSAARAERVQSGSQK